MKVWGRSPLPSGLELALRRIAAPGGEPQWLTPEFDPRGLLGDPRGLLVLEVPRDEAILSLLRADPRGAGWAIAVCGAIEGAGRSLRAGADIFLDGTEPTDLLEARITALVRRDPNVDPVTGLAAAPLFRAALRREFERAMRHRRPLTVLVLAADQEHDDREWLARLAGELRSMVRDGDLLTRLQPARFAVLLLEADAQGGLSAAERVRAAQLPGARTVSIGLAAYPARGMERADDLLGRALESLIQAQRSGGNRIVSFGATDVIWSRDAPDPAAL